MGDAYFLKDEKWIKLFTNFVSKSNHSRKFLGKPVKPEENPTDFEAMAKAYAEKRLAEKELRDYERKMAYFEQENSSGFSPGT